VLTVQEVAEWLNISPQKLYAMLQIHAIPHYRIGKSYRFKKEEIENFLNGVHVPARDNSVQNNAEKLDSDSEISPEFDTLLKGSKKRSVL